MSFYLLVYCLKCFFFLKAQQQETQDNNIHSLLPQEGHRLTGTRHRGKPFFLPSLKTLEVFLFFSLYFASGKLWYSFSEGRPRCRAGSEEGSGGCEDRYLPALWVQDVLGHLFVHLCAINVPLKGTFIISHKGEWNRIVTA